MNIKKIYVIHHSHTDIGYTDPPELIMKYQVNYIHQAINILNDIENNNHHEYKGFKWTCESFGIVEAFLKKASEQEKADFIKHVKKGDIAISGNYLNMTELAGKELYNSIINRAKKFADEINYNITSGMTADVNGLSWHYAQSLVDNNINNLLFCLHSHHGYIAGFRKQTPFFWKTPNGNKLLVWHLEHYMYGNELGLMPNAIQSYSIQDEYSKNPEYIENVYKKRNTSKQLDFTVNRINRYLKTLKDEEYPYDFIPLAVSGLLTDNAPPNPALVKRLNDLNKYYAGTVVFELTTLPAFFDIVRSSIADSIPIYEGEWPDWWSDGVGSFPVATRLFMHAQRRYEVLKRINKYTNLISEQRFHEIENALFYYAEHTYGHSESIRKPYHINTLENYTRKNKCAIVADELTTDSWYDILLSKGMFCLAPNHKFTYKVLNPYDVSGLFPISIPVWHWDAPLFKDGCGIKNIVTNEEYDCTLLEKDANNLNNIVSLIPFEANTEVDLQLFAKKEDVNKNVDSSFPLSGADGIVDIVPYREKPSIVVSEHMVETPLIKMQWSEKEITSLWDKEKQCELINQKHPHGLFTPIYEVTNPLEYENISTVRQHMGRNRKGLNVQRDIGTLQNLQLVQQNDLFMHIDFSYKIKGMNTYIASFIIYKEIKRMDVAIKLEKDICINPENLYISLPLSSGNTEKEEIRLEKAGGFFTPAKEQIPGSLIDFHCIQNAVLLKENNNSVLIASVDTPLIQLGPLAHEDRLLMAHPHINKWKPFMYSWPLNSIWETNFSTDLSGFHEFSYSITWGAELHDEKYANELAKVLCSNLTAFRI